MNKLRRVLRSIAAAVGGYAVIMLLTTVGFKPLGNIIPFEAPLRIHFLGALVAIVSGLLGGATAAGIAGRAPVAHATAVLLFLFLDTAIVLSRPIQGPLWFDLLGAVTLMLATVAGGVVWKRLMPRAATPA